MPTKQTWGREDYEISLLDESERVDLQYAEWAEEQRRDAKAAAQSAATKAAYAEIFDKQRKGGLR